MNTKFKVRSSKKDEAGRGDTMSNNGVPRDIGVRLLGGSGLLPTRRLAELQKEADELVRILATIGKKTETP